VRGDGERRPAVKNVELDGSEVINVGFEMVVRGAIGRRDVDEVGANASQRHCVKSIVLDGARSFSGVAAKSTRSMMRGMERDIFKGKRGEINGTEDEYRVDAIVNSSGRVNTQLVSAS